DRGLDFLAMDYVEGKSLDVLLKKRVLERQEGVEILAQVARAIAHAHEQGVIHRDLKPANILVDREGRARVTDFGLAKDVDELSSLTHSGALLGTPLYMSPEQARRRAIAFDHRTDLYSLGATIYEALTLEPPLRGKDYQDTLAQIVSRDPQPVRARNPRVPRDLETVVMKCLRKEARDRYATAETLAQDLRRFARGEPVEARPQSPWERAVTRIKRQKAKLLVAAVMAALLLSLAWLAHARRSAEREAQLARYEPAVLEVMRKIHAGQFSLKVESRGAEGLLSFPESDALSSPLAPEDFRALQGPRGSLPLEGAVKELEEVAAALPERRGAHYQLAKAYRLLGRLVEARREIDRTLDCDPGFVPASVLRWEIESEGSPGGEDALDRIAPREQAGWERSWLEAYRGARASDWRRAAAACGELIQLSREEEPYVGCEIEA
ncbi:MAG: serine/threonine protein kinase, partial [Planctomycetes bacterium]|nr:serine/threonine protein kinase [Planctomycetota bacterium]